MSDVAIKLREARALIERGWAQRAYRIGDRRCALGAITDVTGENWPRDPELTKPLVQATCVGEPYHLVAWNDAPERTQADVLAAFDKAISLAEQSS